MKSCLQCNRDVDEAYNRYRLNGDIVYQCDDCEDLNPFCNKCGNVIDWYTACYDDEGDYVHILERLEYGDYCCEECFDLTVRSA